MKSPGNSEFKCAILHRVSRCSEVLSCHKPGVEVGVSYEKTCMLDFQADKKIHVKIVPDIFFILQVEGTQGRVITVGIIGCIVEKAESRNKYCCPVEQGLNIGHSQIPDKQRQT